MTTPCRSSCPAFTLLEAMISVIIFALLMVCVASVWMASWRAAERVMNGEGSDARADFVLKRLSESITAAVYHKQPQDIYTWVAQDDRSGGLGGDKVSFVTALSPDAATSSDRAPLERIQLQLLNGENGKRQLVMLAGPFTMEDGNWQRQVVLLENVQSFRVQFWSEAKAEWSDGWSDDEHGPLAVRIGISVEGEKVSSDWNDFAHTCTARVDAMFAKETIQPAPVAAGAPTAPAPSQPGTPAPTPGTPAAPSP